MKSMVSVWTTLNNLRKIFYDTKHCAVSLRQLSFLLCYVLIISPSPVMWGLAYCKCYIKRYILLILISATCFESSLSFSFGWQASVSCLVAQLLVVCFVVNRDGFEDSMFETKTKASSLRGQGQGQGQFYLRPRPRPRPVLFETKAKAKAKASSIWGQGQGQFYLRPRPRPKPVIMIVEKMTLLIKIQ